MNVEGTGQTNLTGPGKAMAGGVIFLIVIAVLAWFGARERMMSSVSVLDIPQQPMPPEEVVRVTPSLAHAESTLVLAPERTTVSVGQRFTLDVVVQPGSNKVSGVELHVKYDPKQLKLEGVVGAPKFSLELQPAKIDEEKGAVSIALGVPLSDASVSSEQPFATLSFVALAPSVVSRIEIQETSLVSADNESQNVLKAVKAAQVVISSGSTE